MKFTFLKRKKFWKRFVLLTIGLPILLFTIILLYVYFKQDEIVQDRIAEMNKTFEGKILVGDSHLAPFENFPDLSIKVDSVRIFENKNRTADKLLDVKDIYIGFNFWDIISGNFDIQSIIVEDGFFNIVKHTDGSINLMNAIKTEDTVSSSDEFNIHIKEINLKNIDVHKLDESTGLDVETFIHYADGGFKSTDDVLTSHVDTKFEMNVIDNGDTTYIKHKHFELHTDFKLDKSTGIIDIDPSGLRLEHADFELVGTIDVENDLNLDLEISGTKSNFDMLIAFAPEELIPTLERYENAGDIYFNAKIKGKSANSTMPLLDVEFGANDAYLKNVEKAKKLDHLGFKGHFTNGAKRDMSTTEFSLENMTARLETGNFKGSVFVTNFDEPEVDMQLNSDFNLQFLADFINLDVERISGKVEMEMRFHDVVDLDNPQAALNDLNQAYFTELIVTNLNLATESLPVPLKDLNLHMEMNGAKAVLDKCNFFLGESDLSFIGTISDLPALVHHTDIPVTAHLEVKSKFLDIAAFTDYSEAEEKGIDEQIENLSLGLTFITSAKSVTEAKHLPHGEFFIDDLYADLKHYPHKLHDFHSDIKIDEHDLSIIDFTGYIDDSDFHFNGLVHDYDFWMQEKLNGDIDLDISLKSDLLRLEDLFSYQGENYVPEDYRHEEFEKLAIHINSALHFRDSELKSVDLDVDRVDAKMHVHPMRFENFNGRVHYEDDHIVVEQLKGKIGRTKFDMDLNYYLGEDESIRKRDNHFGLKANYIDFDQLFSYDLDKGKSQAQLDKQNAQASKSLHEEVFNIYQLPFTDMTLDMDVKHFIYHRIDLKNVFAKLRTTQNHYIYVDTLSMAAAGGKIYMNGYFNGSNPDKIYLSPNLRLKNVDIDKMMFKFENFGQDELISENVHGKLTTNITGKIHVYPDFVPDLSTSEIHMDVELLKGKLVNYEPIMLLSEYLGDRDLSVIRFDTLQNHFDITNGTITIPNMTLETTVGHFDISGKHDANDNIEYYLRIPWKLIKQEAKGKIFGSKEPTEYSDEIVEKDPNGKTRYLNLKMIGTLDDYKIRLGKDKSIKK